MTRGNLLRQDAKSKLNFKNVEIITADMNDFETAKLFDRVVSIEMFEHMRNYEKLLGRVIRLA